MSQTLTPTATEAPPAPAATAAPALDQPTVLSPANSAPTIEAPAPEPTATAPEPAPVAPEAAPPVEAAKPTELSLLESAEPAKTETAPKAAEPEKAAEPVAEETISYEAFKFPEGIVPDEKALATFQDIAAKHKLDHETAQGLLDLHTGMLKAYQDHLLAEQVKAFEATKRDWRNKSLADEQIGGAGHRTAMMAAARMRDMLVPDAMRDEFADFLAQTGVGDHPVFIKLFHNAARIFDEPAPPPIPHVQPVPDRGNPRPSRGRALYDHPSSQRAVGR